MDYPLEADQGATGKRRSEAVAVLSRNLASKRKEVAQWLEVVRDQGDASCVFSNKTGPGRGRR